MEVLDMLTVRRTVFSTVIPMLLACLNAGCSNKGSDKVRVTTVDAKSNRSPKPRKGIIVRNESDLSQTPGDEADVTVERLVMQVKQERFIIARPGETIRLYAEWSGIDVDELKLINDDKLPTFGQKYILSLTASEFSDFERKRQDYWTERKKEMYDQYDVKPVEYIIKKNDTLDGISRKHDVPLWFLVMHNEACDPYRLSPGTKLIIPKLDQKTHKKPIAEEGDQISEEDSREVFPVIVKKGETIGEYAKWGQISIQDIKRANRNLKSLDRIRVGNTVNLPLTAKQFRRFQELRKGSRKK